MQFLKSGSVCLTLCVLAAPVMGADWTRFRGPNGSGISPDKASVPTRWSDGNNLKWKVALPGPGSSSPIVVGDRIYVTCWTGYGASRDANSQADLRRHLICIDRHTGKTVWSKAVEPELPEDRYGGMFAQHGYASHTPVSDGKRVYVFYGKTGVLAYTMDGEQVWHTKVGSGLDQRGWGSSCSPILYKNLVIVTASAESKSMVALDKDTGKEVWKCEAGGFGSTWGTPILVEVDKERTDLVLGVPFEIWGFNPDTGKLRWFCEGLQNDSYCSSVVAHDGVIYAFEGQRGGSIAIRAGGKDDVSKTHVVWSGRDQNRIVTPVVSDDRIYFVSGRMLNCVDAKTGKSIYKERLAAPRTSDTALQPGAQPGRGGFGGQPGGGRGGRGGMGGQDYGSPVVADGKLYYITRSGDGYVFKLGDKFEQLAVNRVTSESEDFSATPAVCNGELIIRSSKHLYCISATK